MKKATKIILLSLTAVLLFASMLQKRFNVPELRPLQGVVSEQGVPALTLKNYYDGSVQKGLEEHLQYHFGFRPPVIRLYNQYLWDCFRKTYVNRGNLTFGKDGWLYEPWFVEDYYQSLAYTFSTDSADMAKQFQDEAKRVYQLQHILKDYGTDLMVCLLPGKDLIYPEHLPENTKYYKEKKITARDYFGPTYEQMGVNHINVEQWFLHMKDTVSFPLFPKTGTHWTNLAAIYVTDSIIRYMEALKGCNMHNLVIGEKYEDEAHSPDADLESLLNLIRPLKRDPLYYATVAADQDSSAIKPRVIAIGDSYWWNISGQVPLKDVFSYYPYWYYFSTVYFDGAPHPVQNVNLVQELLSADFVLLSYCSSQLYRLNNGFTKQALIALCYDPEEIVAIKSNLKQNIQQNEPWITALEERARQDNKDLDILLDETVNELINKNPAAHLPALRDSIPNKRSKLANEYYNHILTQTENTHGIQQ